MPWYLLSSKAQLGILTYCGSYYKLVIGTSYPVLKVNNMSQLNVALSNLHSSTIWLVQAL